MPRKTSGAQLGLQSICSRLSRSAVSLSIELLYTSNTISRIGGCAGFTSRGGVHAGSSSAFSSLSQRSCSVLRLEHPGSCSLVSCSDQIMTVSSLGQLSKTILVAFGA